MKRREKKRAYQHRQLGTTLLSFFALSFSTSVFFTSNLMAASARQFASSSPFQTGVPASFSAPSKLQVLENLKVLQTKQVQQLDATNQSIQRVLQETRTVSFQKGNDSVASQKILNSLPDRLIEIQSRRDELKLRGDFVTQLIAQIESKWNAQSLGQFLEQILFEMALNELTNPSNQEASNDPVRSRIWLFYTYLSVAIREIPDPREDLLAFLSGYMEFSSIQSPKSPLEFLDSRNYTNGAISQTARPIQREQLGTLVDKRLQALSTTEKELVEKTTAEKTIQKTIPNTTQKTTQKTIQGNSITKHRDTERADIELRFRAEPTPFPSTQSVPGYE